MRIAFVIPGGGGGGARSVLRIATGLIERGHEIRILHPTPRRHPRAVLRHVYLRLRYGRRNDWTRRFPGVVRPYHSLTPEVVGRNDFVVGVGVDCVLAIADLPPQCGIKVHNSRGMEPWIMDRMLRAWQLSMPRIVVASYLEREMRSRGSNDPIFVVHNGVDRSEYFPSVPEDQRDGIGTVYHGAAVKAPDVILSVLHRFHDCRPDLPLYVFGSFRRPRGLPRAATYVRFPSLAVARDLYSRSLVWFCASRHEGLPNPLFEAMACGCAVVSTDCGGPSDQIENGTNGFIVPVGDEHAMVTRILEMLDSEELRARFVAASQVVLDRMTWKRAVDEFESAFYSILDARPR